MGYNISRVPTVYNAIYHRKSEFGGRYLENFEVHLTENGTTQSVVFNDLPDLGFIKPEHWWRAATKHTDIMLSEKLHAVDEDA
jgi:hypothetical protein